MRLSRCLKIAMQTLLMQLQFPALLQENTKHTTKKPQNRLGLNSHNEVSILAKKNMQIRF